MELQKIYHIEGRKIVLKIRHRICESAEEMVESGLFHEIVARSIRELTQRESILLGIFPEDLPLEGRITMMQNALKYLIKMPLHLIPNLVPKTERFIEQKDLIFRYIEFLYNFWRGFDRFIVCDSEGDSLDQRPYRTFNETVEALTHLVRQTYREIQENITGEHPNTYRQVRAGAGFAAIALPKVIPLPDRYQKMVHEIGVIRQVLLNPPLTLNPPMNKRKGGFKRIDMNLADYITLDKDHWLCFPAKVGPLVILIYFHEIFYELGFSLVNLFEIATDEDLKEQPRGIYFFGAPPAQLESLGDKEAAFYEDLENKIFVGAVPGKLEYGYFGYLKKMVLTLHNCAMMRAGFMPYHGSLTKIVFKGHKEANILIIGDTGTGKSETLAAFQELGSEHISDIIPIADDMGSLAINENGRVIGYGTEIGAFLRLDDLKPGAAFAQLDRAIFMSVSQINARVIIPITQLNDVVKGVPVDYVLYANNYENVDADHEILERFSNSEEAMRVFREGTAMSKGTTTSTGLTHSYYANIFGPPEYRDLHEPLAKITFEAFFTSGTFVGQMRSRLGITGYEQKGPEEAAKALIELILSK
jgi:hypothetical protein